MSCYIRHMDDVLTRAGIENNKENRKKIDCYLKDKFDLPVNVRSCPDVWKVYIKPILNDEAKTLQFVAELKTVLEKK